MGYESKEFCEDDEIESCRFFIVFFIVSDSSDVNGALIICDYVGFFDEPTNEVAGEVIAAMYAEDNTTLPVSDPNLRVALVELENCSDVLDVTDRVAEQLLRDIDYI